MKRTTKNQSCKKSFDSGGYRSLSQIRSSSNKTRVRSVNTVMQGIVSAMEIEKAKEDIKEMRDRDRQLARRAAARIFNTEAL